MIKKILLGILITTILAGGATTYLAWIYIFKPNSANNQPQTLYIRSHDNFDSLIVKLKEEKLLMDIETFEWTAKKMNLPNHIYGGRYILEAGVNNKALVTLLRAGSQTPIMVTFNNVRTKEQLAQKFSEQLETDSAEIAERLHNVQYAQKFGFTQDNFACMFIPNTYELYWNISPDELFERFNKEYNTFWNTERKAQAKKLKLSPIDVSILASIVEKESAVLKEYPIIAGVYINRILGGIPLQADPTVVFAIGDFSIKRVLHKHLEVNSPYNTYKHRGLPPGPIGVPSPQAINSVLNRDSHNYLYFCAKDDFSGQHVFAKTLRQHNVNARLYRKALSKRNIYK